MVIWPKKVVSGDEGWDQALALLMRISLDTRRPDGFFTSADEYLVRQKIWVDRRLVDAPYYSYCLRFGVSCSILGRIPVDSTSELEEFKRAISEALTSEITIAETNLWRAHRKIQQIRWASSSKKFASASYNSAEIEALYEEARKDSLVAMQHYNAARVVIDSTRDKNKGGVSSTCSHEEILNYLIKTAPPKVLLAA